MPEQTFKCAIFTIFVDLTGPARASAPAEKSGHVPRRKSSRTDSPHDGARGPLQDPIIAER